MPGASSHPFRSLTQNFLKWWDSREGKNNRRGFMGVEMRDLPEGLHAFYDVVGERGFVEVCRLYGGEVLYLPSYKSVLRASRNRDICKRFNGFNSSQLAHEYGITANHVRKIAKYNC